MAKLPEPFDSPPSHFSDMVGIVEELLKQGTIRVRSSPGANVSLKADPKLLNPRAKAKGIEEAGKLLQEVSAMMTLVLRESDISHVFDHMLESIQERDQELSPEEHDRLKKVLAEKADLVEKRLVTARIRRKFHSFRASKHDVIDNVRWEIVERIYDKDERENARGSFVVLRFDLASRPALEFFFLPFVEDPTRPRNFLIECDEDDLQEILDTLQEARTRLMQELKES